MPEPQSIERQCRRLLLAYPAAYRAERGDEIVATMLDATTPGRWPSIADQLDVVAGGLRRRLGTARVTGLDTGLRLAAPVAVALAAGISAFAWWRIEPAGGLAGGPPLFGAFRTMGPIAYAAWLLAAAGWVVPRPGVGRSLVAVAVAITLGLPPVALLTTVDRPPLWVVMTLSAFGALALLGTASGVPSPLDQRLAVPLGAAAVALVTSVAMRAWPPQREGWGYYYQPTLARAGLVVTVAVAAVAVIAVLRQRGPARPWAPDARAWLWAVALLGVPASWMGPFDAAGLVSAAPRFGRLAQVVLASSIAVACLVWLARRSAPRLPAAGAWAFGSAAGLAGFALLAGSGHLGFAPGPVPGYVWCGVAALALTGLLAGGAMRWAVLAAAGLAPVAAFAVSVYSNDWTVGGWPAPGPTLILVMTLALPPMAACAYAAACARRSVRAAAVLVTSLGWLAYVALPSVRSWGPVILILLACGWALRLAANGTRAARPS